MTLTLKGLAMPAIGLGTYKLTGSDCRAAVSTALSLGYRHIDTASFYANEAEIGQGMADASVPREAIFLTTKIWRSDLSAARVRSSVEASLRDLGTDHVDLLLIHWGSGEVPLGETLGAMATLQGEGKVKHLGVSNFTVAMVDEALTHAEIACNQVEHHPYLGQEVLRRAMAARDIATVAYCPLARGRVLSDPVLTEIGRAHGKSGAQVTLRWFLQQAGVGALPKATCAAHIAHNFEVFDFELGDEEMSRIGALDRDGRLVSPPWAPRWD